ncbi:MAG: hypothetical protein AABW91_04210 [Nanoarchaeota archaeon]
MLENKDLASVGVDVLTRFFHVEKTNLAKELRIGEDTETKLELRFKDYVWRGYDFRKYSSKREEVMGIINDPEIFRKRIPKERRVTQGVHYDDSTSDPTDEPDMAWYLTTSN